MKKLDLTKLFWSKSRTKLLEKFYLEYESWNTEWFHIRLLSRDLDEQLNSIKRELESLEEIWMLKSKSENKKKLFFLDKHFPLHEEFKSMFIKTYSPFKSLESYFKTQENLDLVIINKWLENRLMENTTSIVDIFLIWTIDKIEFNNFLSKTFFNKKIKYAIIDVADFKNRLEYNDKLVFNILWQDWNIFIKDSLEIEKSLNKKQ